MATQYGYGQIVTNGLVLCLDAADPNSYPGSGTTWFDLSGGNRNFTLVNGPTWNPGGYFVLDGTNDYMTGPATDTFGFGQTHTVEAVIKLNALGTTTLFNWRSSSDIDRQIMGHVPYSDQVVYYDVGNQPGNATGRISYATNPSLLARIAYMSFRCRTSVTPYRQIFENNVEKVNSGANSTATMTFGSQLSLIGVFNQFNIAGSGGVWNGSLYAFRMYNRALTDAELTQNFNVMKFRYGL